MKILTDLECNTVSGGELTTAIFIDPSHFTDEEKLLLTGLTFGGAGIIFGATIGAKVTGGMGGLVLGAVMGGLTGAYAIPAAFMGIEKLMIYSYRALGML